MDFLPESGEDCRGSGEQDDETDPPEPHTGLRGDKTLTELAQQFDVHANQITKLKSQLVDGVFGGGISG